MVVFETGRVFGGDTSFFYIGSYELTQTRVSGRVRVKRHSESLPSVFGLEDFELGFKGGYNPDRFTLEGGSLSAAQL